MKVQNRTSNTFFVALFFASFFGFSAAAAELSGSWTGTGHVLDPRTGTGSSCGYAEIILEKTPQLLLVHSILFDCGYGNLWKWKQTRFEIRGDELYRDAQRVGMITSNFVRLDLSDEDVDWKVWFELDGPNSLSYVEQLQSTEVSVEISGTLRRASLRRPGRLPGRP
jgi:hypothetical protein